jgi:hypothetical protein
MIDDGGGVAAPDAMRVLGEEARASMVPLAVIAALAGSRALLIETSLALTVAGDAVLALLAGRDDATARTKGRGGTGHVMPPASHAPVRRIGT